MALAAHLLVSCAGSGGGGGLSGGTSDGVSTPRHGLPRYEYPFDSSGKYREEWAKEGEQRKGWNSSRSYADVDFSRGGSSEADEPKKLASTSSSRKKPKKEKVETSRSRLFASREKKVEPKPQVRESVQTRQRTSTSSRDRLFASASNSAARQSAPTSSGWDRSRIPPTVSNFQPRPTSPSVIQPEPRVEVRRAPSVEVARPATPSPPKSQPVVRAPAPKPKPKPKPAPAPKPAPVAKKYHTVAKGDTLYNISVRYKSSVGAIKSRNRLPSDTIRLGQRLEIP